MTSLIQRNATLNPCWEKERKSVKGFGWTVKASELGVAVQLFLCQQLNNELHTCITATFESTQMH